jgi:hypothetical protein
VLFRIAHLHAPGTQMRFRAMAVASGHMDSTQQRRRVRKNGSGAGRKPDCRANEFAGGYPTSGIEERPSHGSILDGEREKTDSP